MAAESSLRTLAVGLSGCLRSVLPPVLAALFGLLVHASSGLAEDAPLYPDTQEVTQAQETPPGTEPELDSDPSEPAVAGLEVITVTADRREAQIQDVPISMVALDADFLEATGTNEFARLQEFVPNLRISPVTDSRSTTIRIRGIGSTGTNAGVDPSVGVFIDGVYQGRAGMSTADFLDLERVEVLRGPQGTLYGKNTAAGAISLVSKRPNYELQATGESVFRDYDGYEVRGSVNTPLVDDALAARVSGYYVTRGGFDVNRFNGEEVNDNNRWGVKGRFLWDITELAELMVTVDWARTRNDCCYGDIITYRGPPSLGPLVAGGTPTGPTFSEIAADRPVGSPFSTLPKEDEFDRVIGANRDTRDAVDIGGVAAEFNMEIGDGTLTWLNAWRSYESSSEFDGDFSVYDAIAAATDTDLDQASSELRYSSQNNEHFDFITGLYFYYQTQNTTDRTSLQGEFIAAAPPLIPMGLASGLQIANAIAGNPPNAPIANVGENRHRTLTVAGFGDGTLHLTDELSFTGGVRVTWEKKTRVGTQTSTISGLIDQPPLLGPDVSMDQERDVTNASGRAILRYFPVEDVMTYGSFSSGFKSGGFNQLRTAGGVPSEFDDESSLNGELGVRTSWFDRRLQANITGFYTRFKNFQALSFDGSSISIRNAGELQSYGFEADITGIPVDGLILSASVGYNIAEYIDFDNGECIVGNLPGCTQDLSGRPLDNAPVYSVSAFAHYEHDLPWHALVGYTRLDYSYTSSFWLAQDLDANLKQNQTHLLDFRVGFHRDDSRWDVSFWVRNVLDEGYGVVGFDVPAVSGYVSINGPPRTLGGTIRLTY